LLSLILKRPQIKLTGDNDDSDDRERGGENDVSAGAFVTDEIAIS